MIPKLALDTNAYRALIDGNETMARLIKTSASIGVPVTVLGEIQFGINYGAKKEPNLLNLNRFLSSPRVETLQITNDTAKIFGEIAAELKRTGGSIQQNDIWIAATCKQYGYALATADQDFTRVPGLEIIGF